MMPGYLASAYPWKRKLAAFTCWLYGRVICVSPEINDAILSLGTAPERIGVVPAFLSTERGEAARDSTLQSWTARHRPLLSTVLFFRPEYGFDVLVSGLARLRRSYPSVGCVVMGSGEQRADAENLVLKAGLEDHVLLMGDVDHSSCLAVMSACDVFLRTTLEDGDSISVREALALGVPVVASRVGTRPAGVILFHPGDGENLIESVKLALAAERPAQPQALQSMERILELYRRVNGLEPSICPN
jgi:glycosyltransferase involved in cell wall biosynthesis